MSPEFEPIKKTPTIGNVRYSVMVPIPVKCSALELEAVSYSIYPHITFRALVQFSYSYIYKTSS